MALGKLLEGAAWFATLSLATVCALTFAPDGAWETFPAALRPARAKLAEFGVAPACYRVVNGAEKSVEGGEKGEVASNDKNGETDARTEDAWRASASVRIGERWKEARKLEGTAFVEKRVDNVASASTLESTLGAESWAREEELAAQTFAPSESAAIGGTDAATDASVPAFSVVAPWGNETAVVAPFETATVGENWDDAIPPFVVEESSLPEAAVEPGANVENATPFPSVDVGTPFDALSGANVVDPLANGGSAEATGNAGVAATVGASENVELNGGADLNASNGVPTSTGLLGQADAALANELNAEASAAVAVPVDETAELRDALAAASVAATPEEIKTAFETLDRIRTERGARLAAEDARTLDSALDRLAFEVFYNPAQTILEPRWQTAPGESLASIAKRLGTTPETLAEINGLKKTSNDATLPTGTALKTVRGPATAEVSVSKKELTFRLNGLYAGRFALGVPENLANLRGSFRVVEKMANPSCDAVDANGQTISIPGGAPENPLGVAWIALEGGVGLQGTNRPELVGQTFPENGGFVFSNREIEQLSVLLPVGAVVAIVD